MNRFGVRFGSFGVSPFAFKQMPYPFLSFLILSAFLARCDASFAINLTCPGDLCAFTFKHVHVTHFLTIHLSELPNGYLTLFSPRAKRAAPSNVHVHNGCKELANGNKILLLISHDLNQQHPLNGLWTPCLMSDEQILKTENDNICSCLNIYLFLDAENKVHLLFQKGELGNLSKEKLV